MVERDSEGLCVCICMDGELSVGVGGALKSIKCEKTDVIRSATYPRFFSPPSGMCVCVAHPWAYMWAHRL